MKEPTIIRSEKISLCRSAKIITIIVSLLVISVGIIMPAYDIINNQNMVAPLLIIFLIIILLFPAFIYMPQRIILSDTQLILQRGIGRLLIPYSEIAEVSEYKTDNPFVEIRILGSGGFLGFFGNFYSKKTGFYTAYLGDYSQAFLIKMKSGKKYLFSCEHHKEIISAIEQKL